MAACGFLGIFMTRKVPGSFSEVLCDSTKATKFMTEQEKILWKDSEECYSSIKLFKVTFE